MAFSHANIIDTRTLADELRDLIIELGESEDEDEKETLCEDIKVYVDIAADLGYSFDESAADEAADALDAFGNRNGALIAEDYFVDYAEQYAEDIGAIDRNAGWPSMFIDWEAAAESLQQDYTSVEIDGQTYLYR